MREPMATLTLTRSPVRNDGSYQYDVAEKRRRKDGSFYEKHIGTLFKPGHGEEFVAMTYVGTEGRLATIAGYGLQAVTARITDAHPKDWTAIFEGIAFLLTVEHRQFVEDWVTEPVRGAKLRG